MNATHGPPRPRDVTFLDRRGVHITGCWFDVAGERYAVPDLERVWEAAGPLDPIAVNAVRATALVLVVGALSGPYLGPRGWLGLGVVVLTTLLISAFALLVGRRQHQLWAEYRCESVRLYQSADRVWFNQVYRALNRARELDRGGVT